MNHHFAYRVYRLPLRTPLRTAHGSWAVREGIVVRLEDAAGHVGYGEIAPIPWFGTETLEAAAARCQGYGDRIDDAAIDALPPEFGCVRFAFAQARTEIAAASARDAAITPPPTTPRLAVAALLPAGRHALTVLDEKLAGGFLAFKWKVGVGAVDDELSLLDDLLARLPAHAKLRLDANGAWTSRQAVRWLERCAEKPLEFVEQPVAPGDDDALLGLAQDYPVTLALDESVVRLAEARRWQEQGWRGVFVIKPALAGPLAEVRAWAETTRADVVWSSAIETTLARSAILRFALTSGLTKRALGFGVGELFGDRSWDGPTLGPIADTAGLAVNPGEAAWNALA